MTVRELIAELQALPNQDSEVGVFCPFDGEGPCTYERPEIFQRPEDGKVQIDPDEGSGQGFK